MIQRIQSVFLILATLLTGALLFLTMAQMASDNTLYELTWRGVYLLEAGKDPLLVVPAWALSILTVTTTAISWITLFLYKKRMLQIRLCALNLGLLLGLSGMIFYMAKSTAKELSAADVSFNWPLVLPLIAFILIVMSIRAIGKDEALVRSLDRIR
jgi:hypothetical protein